MARVLVLQDGEVENLAKLLKDRADLGLGVRTRDLPDEELDRVGRLGLGWKD